MDPNARADPQELLSQSGWLKALARHLVETPDQADDLVQDTLRKALERRPPPTGREQGVRSWLTRVMRNLASNRRRDEGARAWHERAASRSESWTPEEIEERVRLQRTLADAVLDLEEPYRSAITLHYFEGLAPREIARRQEITYEAARQRISRGVGMLRARLDREHGGDRSAWCALLLGTLERTAPPPLPWGSTLLEILLMSLSAKAVAGTVVVLAVTSILLWRSIRSNPQDEPAAPLVEAMAPPVSQDPADEAPVELSAARIPATGSTPRNAWLEAVDRDHDLHGEVVDPTGQPVAGARVEVFRNESSEYSFLDVARTYERRKIAETETDVDGRFSKPLDVGRPFLMEVSAQGFSRELIGNRYAGEYVLVRLHLGASIEGRVKRADDGKAIAGAGLRVWPVSGDKPQAKFLLEGVTDQAGNFRFDGLTPMEFYLEVTPPIGALPMWRRIELVEGERHQVEIAVEAGPTLRGRVVDAKTGMPIANAEVGAAWVFRRPVKTDASGEFVYAGFPLEGIYDLHARAAGYGRMERVVRKSSEDEFPERVDFELHSARSARGRILDMDGAPVPGAYVAAVSHEYKSEGRSRIDWGAVLTTRDGGFELENLRSDMLHTLLVRKEGYGTVVYDFPASEAASPSVDFSDITLPPMSVMRGSVVDESGEAVPDQLVTLRGWNSDRTSPPGGVARRSTARMFGEGADIYVGQRRARTDDLGRFSFADLSAGTYSVDTELRGSNRQVDQTVEVPRASRIEGIRIVLPGGGTIEGRVHDFQGRPVPKAHVRADPEDAPDGITTSTATLKDGSFVLRGLSPGTYTVRAESTYWSTEPGSDSRVAPTELYGLRPGQRDLELVLRKAALLRGRVFFADGQPAAGIPVVGKSVGGNLRTYARTDDVGRFQMTMAEDDLVDLEAHPPWSEGVGPDVGSEPASEPEASGARISRVAPGGENVTLRLPKKP